MGGVTGARKPFDRLSGTWLVPRELSGTDIEFLAAGNGFWSLATRQERIAREQASPKRPSKTLLRMGKKLDWLERVQIDTIIVAAGAPAFAFPVAIRSR